MTITNGYCTRAELKAQLDETTTVKDLRLDAIITGVSRAIDDYCQQFFYDSGTTSARVYPVTDAWKLRVHPFSTTTGLIVKVDSGNTGTYDTTWTLTTDYVVAPYNGIDSAGLTVPYTEILATGPRWFPIWTTYSPYIQRPRAQVTAQWGWASVPDVVREACILKATRLARRKDAPEMDGGGFGAVGLFKISQREDPDVVSLLASKRNLTGTVMR